jgi:hypothetical protein
MGFEPVGWLWFEGVFPLAAKTLSKMVSSSVITDSSLTELVKAQVWFW